MTTSQPPRRGALTDFGHLVRSNAQFRSALAQASHQLGISDSALFRFGVVEFIRRRPEIDQEIKQQITEANLRLPSGALLQILSTTGEG